MTAQPQNHASTKPRLVTHTVSNNTPTIYFYISLYQHLSQSLLIINNNVVKHRFHCGKFSHASINPIVGQTNYKTLSEVHIKLNTHVDLVHYYLGNV